LAQAIAGGCGDHGDVCCEEGLLLPISKVGSGGQ
jgi:hypothetical protein